MPFVTVENHVNLSLINLTVAPGTFLAFVVLAFTYLYILHARNNPVPPRARRQTRVTYFQPEQDHSLQNAAPAHDRRAGADVRRSPFAKRFYARFRAHKQRDTPAVPVSPLWLPFTSFWLPLRQRIGDGRVGVGRQIQSTSVATRRKRQPKQRLLE